MKTAFILAVTGSINSGKSTLARRLAEALNAVLLSSDEIREALPAAQRRHGARVFAAMRERLAEALVLGQPVVLDSTGMSPRFRAILQEHRARLRHVHLRVERVEVFEERERHRPDRPNGALPRGAFRRSCRTIFAVAPDLTVETDDISPQELYDLALRAVLEAKDP